MANNPGDRCDQCGGRFRPRQRVNSAGHDYAVLQCPECGKSNGIISIKGMRKKYGKIPPFDDALKEKLSACRSVLFKQRADAKSEYRKKCYNAYLQSHIWKVRRARILKRSKGKCEKCGATAAQVHHESYKNMDPIEVVFNEYDDELTAVCMACHEDQHPHMREDK